jgi:hypothetical protein
VNGLLLPPSPYREALKIRLADDVRRTAHVSIDPGAEINEIDVLVKMGPRRSFDTLDGSVVSKYWCARRWTNANVVPERAWASSIRAHHPLTWKPSWPLRAQTESRRA